MVARRKFRMQLDRSQACVMRWIRWREACLAILAQALFAHAGKPHADHAAQGMELHRHTQWLVRGHQGTTPTFSQWPLAPKGQGKGKGGKPDAAPRAPQKTLEVEGWAPRSSLASSGAGAVQCQICSGGGFEDSEGGVSKASAPQQKVA